MNPTPPSTETPPPTRVWSVDGRKSITRGAKRFSNELTSMAFGPDETSARAWWTHHCAKDFPEFKTEELKFTEL